jgi:tetratricopeptide (TPR) repeat protein
VQLKRGRGIESSAGLESLLLGRQVELRRLGACLESAFAGRGSFVAVSGISGIGKSRLLAEFSQSCRERGVTVIQSRANGAQEPYAAWRQLATCLLGGSAKLPATMSRAYHTVLARLFQGSVRRPPPPLPAEQARYRIYDAVREFLVACTSVGPLALLLDDVQFLDEPSLRLLRYLLPFIEEQPIVIAIAYDERDPKWSQLTASPPVAIRSLQREHIFLSGLSPGDVAEMLRRRGLAGLAANQIMRLHELTRGHPLHVEMMGELLCRRGHQGQEVENSLIDNLALAAPSAERAVTSLVGQLSPEIRCVLAACAIFPDFFTASDAAVLSDRREGDAVALFKGNVSCLVECVNRTARVYRFRHSLVRQVLSESVDPANQMLLQRRAINRLGHSRRARPSVWQIAQWYHTSRVLPGAAAGVAICLAAARRGDEESAPELKVTALRMARDLCYSAKRQSRVSLLTNLGVAAAEAGAFSEAAAAIRDAVAILDRNPRTRSQACDLLVEAATSLHDSGANASFWVPFQKSAYKRLGKRRDLRWARMRLLEPGRMRKISGPPLQVGRWLGLDREAVGIARHRGNDADYCRTLLIYEWLTVADVDALLARAQRWRSPLTRAHALSVAAETLMYRHGEFDRACRLLQEQLTLHASRGSIVEQAKSLVRLTMAQLAAGEIEAAISTRIRARGMVARLGPGYLIYEHAGTTRGGDLYPEISMESNFAWYLEGNWEAVAEHWVRAVAMEEPGGSPVHIVEAAMAAQAYARLGRFADARIYLDELTPVLKKLQPRDWALNGAVGRASHAIWDMAGREYAASYHDLALRLIAAGVADWTNTSLHLTVARMAALLGSGEQAKEYFHRARLKLGRKRKDPRRAIIDYDDAVAMRFMNAPDHRRRDRLLKEAMATFRAREMQGWVARAEAEAERPLGTVT